MRLPLRLGPKSPRLPLAEAAAGVGMDETEADAERLLPCKGKVPNESQLLPPPSSVLSAVIAAPPPEPLDSQRLGRARTNWPPRRLSSWSRPTASSRPAKALG